MEQNTIFFVKLPGKSTLFERTQAMQKILDHIDFKKIW
jgi:hypothetical protein